MMLELIPVSIALSGSFIAGFIDLKTTEIPDWVIVLMLVGGGVYASYLSVVGSTFEPILTRLVIGSAAFAFGMLMYFAGQWGGGDAKLLAAILFLLPATPQILNPAILLAFPATIVFNIFLVGAVYSIIYAFVFAYQNRKIIRNFLKEISSRTSMLSVMFLSGTILLAWAWMTWTIGNSANLILYTIPGFIGLFLLWRFLRIVEKLGFVKKIRSADLKEGDMIGEDLESLGMTKRVIRGLTSKEVMAIRKRKEYVMIRDGVRFGPVFFLATLASVLYGDLILLIF